MDRSIDRFSNGVYDVLVIGAGINGAAIANMSAYNGCKTALFEKGDFASGTSSKSTKLIHGGLRYLEHFEFDLVRESLYERHVQLKSAAHLVKPLGFIIPVYRKDQRPLWMMKMGVSLYDFLSGTYLIKKHRSLNVQEILDLVPLVKKADLVGGVMYYDAQMDDARLCLENVLSAHQHGADVANYVAVESLLREDAKVVGVVARDLLGGEYIRVRAKKVVCAVGPWTNIFLGKEKRPPAQRIRTTKGIHIVYRGQVSQHALLIPTQKDRRIFFIIPWKGNSLIGTTDTDFAGSPDEVDVTQDDIEYLLREANRVFPEKVFNKENIITTFAGLRPLVYRRGQPSRVSRKHIIAESHSGIIYVMGGKYTTYRKIAEDCLRRIEADDTFELKGECLMYGGDVIEDDLKKVAHAYGIGIDTITYLTAVYGSHYKDVLTLIEADQSLKERICSCSLVIKAQVLYSINTEMAKKSEDIILRRLSVAYTDCKKGDCIKEVNKILSQCEKTRGLQ